MAKLNYATEYLQALEQMFPYVLYFGDLFATPNNGRFRWVNSRVIEVPTISTTAVPMETETPLEPESVITTTSGNR